MRSRSLRAAAKKNFAHVLPIFLKNIMQSLPQYLFWKDKNSIYLGCNKNYAELLGLHSVEEIIGKTDDELNWQCSGHTAEIFQKGDQDTMQGHPITNQEETLVLPNGNKMMTLVSKLPMQDERHKIIGIVGYFTDITLLKEKEQELRQAKQQADAANQAKSAFMMNMTHDIRTPLTGLLGMAKIMAEEMKTTVGKSAAADLLKAGNSLLNLLNEIIEFSKCESGDLPVYDVKFSVHELMNNIVSLIMLSAKEKNLRLNYHIDDTLPDYVIGDVRRLQRILLNLVDNAIKFTPKKGAVTITLQCVSQQAQRIILKISVQDTGIGVPLDKQSLIFTRFSRLNPAFQSQYAGVGLGLALVKRYISELAGEIYVDSQENKGATFTCLIPLRAALLPTAEQVTPPPVLFNSSAEKIRASTIAALNAIDAIESEPSAQKQILFVEDNHIVQYAVTHQLDSVGCTVMTADNGAQALEKIQTNDYDLILMDLGLPDQHGCEVATEIHRWQADHGREKTPIIALSAHMEEAERKRCWEAGMVKALNKPLNDQKVREIMDFLWENRDHGKI